jgi:transcriptional regulator with XRE-family HTH domain
MARAGLGWSHADLAAAAKVGVDTVRRFEKGDVLKERTVEAIQHALEEAGIEFIPENRAGPGVRLRMPIGSGAETEKTSTASPARHAAPRKRS